MYPNISSVVKLVKNQTPPGYLPYSIDVIKSAIEQVCDVDSIKLEEVTVQSGLEMGRYERYELPNAVYDADPSIHVTVQYTESLNYCWQRFVVCKEMCHALLDDVQSRSRTVEEIERVVDYLVLPHVSQSIANFSNAAKNESLAIFAAGELLCPLEDRKQAAAMRVREPHKFTNRFLAREFRVPLVMVKGIFDDGYINYVDDLLSTG